MIATRRELQIVTTYNACMPSCLRLLDAYVQFQVNIISTTEVLFSSVM